MCAILAASCIEYSLAWGENANSYGYARAAQQGRLITPVQLNLTGKNPDAVYRGSYFVNALNGCNRCHTCPSYAGIDPFKAGGATLGFPPKVSVVNATNFLAGGVIFSGPGLSSGNATVLSPNLTPDNSGQPGGLTYDNFKMVMQSGTVATKPGHVLQVMPWPVFRNLDEADLLAIYQYLSAVPQAHARTGCTYP
jgi:hypothetical protein